MKKIIIKKSHVGMPPQYYARIPIEGRERMMVLCSVADVEAQRDPETFLHHKLIEAVMRGKNIRVPNNLSTSKDP